MSHVDELPRWDLTEFFPSPDSEAYRSEYRAVVQSIRDLEAQFDAVGVREGGVASVGNLSAILTATNEILDRVETIGAYVGCLVTTDTRSEINLAAESELDAPMAQCRKLLKRLTAWLGGLDIQEALSSSEVGRKHEYALHKAQVASQHLLSPAEEALASDLELTGSVAWSKLYNNVTSQIEVDLELEGEVKTMPVSSIRSLASHADRGVRRAAYHAELSAWQRHEVTIAAAMNGIKGETLLLSSKRGWASPLEEACFHANIDRGTLDAMMTAAKESFPDFRRYMGAKARALGLEQISFYDIFAPLPSASADWRWESATEFVATQFDRYSIKMGDLARRSYAESWIDVGPRPGKVDGAFCMPMRGDESRILMNFKPTFDSVRTLAHELGHAYHTTCLAGKTAIQRETPMTLAETASIFCETIVKNAVLDHGTAAEKLTVLEAAIGGACQTVVDISSRFLFEQAVFEKRSRRELSPREYCDAMLDAQRETYGDGMSESERHGYMWAAKPHYYGSSFYNFPYMFGLLFSLGLYAQYRREPAGFHDRYDALLGSTGLADAATLAGNFGIDIRTPDFWRASLDQIRADIEQFERLV